MTTELITLSKDTPISEALHLLVQANVTGAPVVDGQRSLLGIITEKDILRSLHADRPPDELTVEDFMSTPVIYFDESESAANVAECLMTYDFRRVCVTRAGKLTGIISRRDILVHMLNEKMLESAPVET